MRGIFYKNILKLIVKYGIIYLLWNFKEEFFVLEIVRDEKPREKGPELVSGLLFKEPVSKEEKNLFADLEMHYGPIPLEDILKRVYGEGYLKGRLVMKAYKLKRDDSGVNIAQLKNARKELLGQINDLKRIINGIYLRFGPVKELKLVKSFESELERKVAQRSELRRQIIEEVNRRKAVLG